uniref:BIOACTIVE peptide P4=PUTATIVE ESOPHAGEAL NEUROREGULATOR n=1 Tax=Perinereis vancaurica TaxID=6355 RepID=Q9TWH6_PERVA|nr:bioactive peptide P4=putative esophageal neuroregulator [Perinereis vancaurica, Peptide, 8 aa] [Perinereis vancaurica]prf//2116223D esophagus excitation peptide [Perinereis vancaurica]
FYEGDVPY